MLAFYEFRTRWFASLALEQQDKNLFFDLGNSAYETEGPDFDRDHAMLPDAWKELYRWFWSFGMTTEARPGLYWINTPFSYSSRLDLASYRKRFGGKKMDTTTFEKRLNSDWLRCWLATDTGDALWLDEQRCDKTVYHVHQGEYDSAMVLSDPNGILDRYLAHLVSGSAASSFDFRAG